MTIIKIKIRVFLTNALKEPMVNESRVENF